MAFKHTFLAFLCLQVSFIPTMASEINYDREPKKGWFSCLFPKKRPQTVGQDSLQTVSPPKEGILDLTQLKLEHQQNRAHLISNCQEKLQSQKPFTEQDIKDLISDWPRFSRDEKKITFDFLLEIEEKGVFETQKPLNLYQKLVQYGWAYAPNKIEKIYLNLLDIMDSLAKTPHCPQNILLDYCQKILDGKPSLPVLERLKELAEIVPPNFEPEENQGIKNRIAQKLEELKQ